MSIELYKVVRGAKKRFYESKKSFEQYWPDHLRYSQYYDVIAYKIDWEKRKWVCIRKVGPKQ